MFKKKQILALSLLTAMAFGTGVVSILNSNGKVNETHATVSGSGTRADPYVYTGDYSSNDIEAPVTSSVMYYKFVDINLVAPDAYSGLKFQRSGSFYGNATLYVDFVGNNIIRSSGDHPAVCIHAGSDSYTYDIHIYSSSTATMYLDNTYHNGAGMLFGNCAASGVGTSNYYFDCGASVTNLPTKIGPLSGYGACYEGSSSFTLTHEHNITTSTRAASCTTTGMKTDSCSYWYCNYSMGTVIPATGHTYVSAITSQPTCKSSGSQSVNCITCGEGYTEIIYAGPQYHTWGNWIIREDSDCTHTGTKYHTCTTCGETQTAEVPLKEHTYGEWQVLSDPTCTDEGVTFRTCTVCGYESTERGSIEPTGHTPGQRVIVQQPTCTENGVAKVYCSTCGEVVDEQVVEVLGHDLDTTGVIFKQPTCTEAGILRHNCSRCDYYVDDVIPENGHSFDEEPIITKVPTCAEEGEMYYHCPIDGHDEYCLMDPDPNNHVHTKLVDVSSTYTGDWICLDCTDGEGNQTIIKRGKEIPQDVEDIPEEVVEEIKESINEIIPQKESEEEQQKIEEAMEATSVETLMDITSSVSEAFNEIAALLESGEITKEEYEEKVEIVATVTENAVVVGSKMENVEEQNKEVLDIVPEDSPVDLGGALTSFYENCYKDLLGKKDDEQKPAGRAPRKAINNQNSNNGIDFNTSLDVYKKVEDYCDTSVEHMTEATMSLRVCSGEKVVQQVNFYVQAITVSSFRDFDKDAANAEFVENAYQATLLEMQQQTLASLEEEYNAQLKNAVGTAKQKLEETYNTQKAAVEDIEQFEIMIIEVMRQKYMTIINNRYENGEYTKDEYDSKVYNQDQLDEFEVIYKDIFKDWALGDDYDSGFDIGLEELSTTVIGDFTQRIGEPHRNAALTKGEIALLVSVGVSILVAAGGVIFVNIFCSKEDDK